MEDHDREFEAFLGEFRLRQHSAFPIEAPLAVVRKPTRWMRAVAAVVVVGVFSILLVRYLSPDVVVQAVVEAAGDSAYTSGQGVEAGVAIRSGPMNPLRLRLVDGTRVEMSAQSELSVESTSDGLRLRLKDGSIVVTAAMHHGRLDVETEDASASVIGTVSLVQKTSLGTRVGVCEGEAEVRQGLMLQKVLPGQQVSTSPAMEGSIREATAWSSTAAQFVRLFEPPAVPVSPSPTPGAATPPRRSAEPQPQEPAPQPPAPRQSAPARPAEGPSNDAGADSAAKDILNRACGSCHVVGLVENARYRDRQSYEALISRQVNMGAGITPAEAQVLVEYLFRTYGVRMR